LNLRTKKKNVNEKILTYFVKTSKVWDIEELFLFQKQETARNKS